MRVGKRGDRLETDETILEKVRGGDIESFEGLVAAYQNKIFSFIYRMVISVEDARDLTQEVFLQAFRALETFRGDAKFSTWLYRIAANKTLDFLRRNKTGIADTSEKVGEKLVAAGLSDNNPENMLLFFGSIFVSSFINFEQIMALVVPVVMFYSIFDTQQLVKKMNSGEQIGDRPLFDLKAITFNQSWIGYGLIVIGLLALLNGVLPRYLPILGFIRSIMPSILIIGTGLLILYRSTRKES